MILSTTGKLPLIAVRILKYDLLGKRGGYWPVPICKKIVNIPAVAT